MKVLDNDLLEGAARLLAARLPPGWSVDVLSDRESDGSLRITSSAGRSRDVPVGVKRRIDPRSARELLLQRGAIVVAPYISRSVREVLEEREASYVDQTGNARVVLDEPGLFVLTSGADANPWPDKRRLSLRGVKAGRVVRVLVTSTPPLGVREIADLAGTDPGYVSRLLGKLDSEALVDRARGKVERVAWRKLLARWAEDAPLESRAVASTWLAPRGLESVRAGLSGASFPYALTGSAAAAQLAPVAPTRLLSVYVENPRAAAEALGLRPAESGANVLLLQPEDEAVLVGAAEVDGLSQASLPVVVADLLSGPGRSPAEGEALMEWMAEHEGAWRG